MLQEFHKPQYDVIISGAGPVGLFLACELALRRCRVLVIERSERPDSPLKQLPFGVRGLNSLSVESLYRRGLLEELAVPKRLKDPHMRAATGAQRQVGHFAGLPLLAGNVDESRWHNRLPSSTATSLIAELEELETVLCRRAETLGVTIRRGAALASFTEDEEGMTVAVNSDKLRAQWLVGCDGARSIVRRAGGFDFEGTEPEFTGYSVRADLVDAEKLKPGRQVTPTGMYLQSQPGFFALQDFDGGAFHGSGQPISREHIQAVFRRVSGTDVTVHALHLATTWTDRARQATTYRSGRVLLAGDAAHIHAPLGGQGLNLGLGDAMNLGWKLAATVRAEAPEGLLDSYTRERHPIGASVLDWSRAQAALMKPDPGLRALQGVFRDLLTTREGATYVAGRLWGVTAQYDLGGGHPLVGFSAPNFGFDDGTTLGERMRDGRGILLDLQGHDALATWAGQYGGQLQYVTGRVRESLGVSALLIRPDGFVAWGSDGIADATSLQQAANCWFTKEAR